MQPLLLVMLGGAAGSAARHLTARLMLSWFGPGYPWGTLSVNIVGGFLMGVLVGTLARSGAADGWRLLLGVGALGGFTTFSAFSLDAVLMLQRGEFVGAALYVIASTTGAILALLAGLSIVRAVA